MPPKVKVVGISKAVSSACSPARASGRKRTQVQLYSDDQSTEMQAVKSAKKAKRSDEVIEVAAGSMKPIPTRNKDGDLVFADHPNFRPNLTPAEVIRLGSFGGTYFRPIYSSITKKHYTDEAWRELPPDWLEGLNIPRTVSSSTYRTDVNKYREKCGQGLDEWESSGWITSVDPYGTYYVLLI